MVKAINGPLVQNSDTVPLTYIRFHISVKVREEDEFKQIKPNPNTIKRVSFKNVLFTRHPTSLNHNFLHITRLINFKTHFISFHFLIHCDRFFLQMFPLTAAALVMFKRYFSIRAINNTIKIPLKRSITKNVM